MFSSYFTSIVIKWTSFTHFNFIFFFFILLFLTSQYDAVSPFSDKSTLLRLKNSLSDPAGVLSTWNPSSGHCSWYGVRCDSGLRVVSLNITGNGGDGHRSSHPCSDFGMFPLYGFGIRRSCVGVKGSLLGKFPSLISELTELRVLSLPFNGLEGSIPEEIWSMEKLEVLDLEGAMPEEIVSLPKLRILWAPVVNLEGSFPRSWGACADSEMVNLAQNFFTGEFLDRLGLCKKLHFLDLSSNNLNGELSEELHVPCMSVFDVSGNMLSGSVPDFSNNFCSPLSQPENTVCEKNNRRKKKDRRVATVRYSSQRRERKRSK